MNLIQAIGEGQRCQAYRVVGALRIIVEKNASRIKVQVQCRSGRRWMTTDNGGGVRYLDGVLRDVDGSFVVACSDLSALNAVAQCLPAAYQHLLTPDKNDWQIVARNEAG